MKGVVFRGIESLVIDKCGMNAWEELLKKNSPNGRVYISPTSYPDEEMFALLNDVSIKLNMAMPDILKVFGKYLFNYLVTKHPMIIKDFDSFPNLIVSIDKVIHAEVAKLYYEPSLPKINAVRVDEGFILMDYYSKRKLCMCAEGLIYGAASYFDINVTLNHIQCMHDGFAKCIIEVAYEEKNG